MLLPTLFNIYSEELFRETLDGVDEGITVNGETMIYGQFCYGVYVSTTSTHDGKD